MDAAKLIHLLFQTTRAISQGVNHILTAYGLYSSEWSMIVALKETGPISQNALASYLSIEPAAISKTIVKLEDKGFIERKAGQDKREKKVFLTDSALTHYALWETTVDTHRRSLLADLSTADQETLSAMLQSIYANSQKHKK